MSGRHEISEKKKEQWKQTAKKGMWQRVRDWGMRTAPILEKSGFSWGASGRNVAQPTPDFSPVRLMFGLLTSWSVREQICFFSDDKLVLICYSSIGNSHAFSLIFQCPFLPCYNPISTSHPEALFNILLRSICSHTLNPPVFLLSLEKMQTPCLSLLSCSL